MTTYTFRDARRQMIDEALTVLDDAQVDLRMLLEAEQRALQTDDWTVTDDTYLAVGNDWLWSVNLGLKALVDSDPALTALGRSAVLTDAQSAAVEVLPRTPMGPPPGFYEQVRAALAEDEAVFNELIHTAHRLWILMDATHRAYPFDDVGVLLPLRLETLFDPPASQYNEDPNLWKLSLRVTPDEVSIRRDNPFVSPGEQTALIAFWQAIEQPGDLVDTWLEGDDAGVAWQLLCDQVTAPRAAWLVATVEFHRDGDTVVLDLPPDMPTKAPDNRVEGLPPELHVFAVDATTRYFIGRLPMEPTAQIDAKNLTLPLPANLEEEKERWWASWQKAKEVGLGGEWTLPAGVAPQTIRAIYVVGIGNEAPDAHFKAQVDAGETGILRLGMPTNAVQGADTASLGKDATDWQKVAQMRLRQRLDPLQNPAQPAAQAMQLHLTGRTDALPYFPGADASDDTQNSREMTIALFPALWGHWLRDVWQSGDDMFRIALWAFDNLAPEGPLMPLRIAEQPYGLLPVTALSQWQVENAVTAERKAQRQVEKKLAEALVHLREFWVAAIGAEETPALRKRSVVGKSTAEFMELLAQDGYSSRYLWRYFMPAWVGLGTYNLQDALQQQAFIDQTLSYYRSAIDVFGREPAMSYITKYGAKFVRLPLVQPGRMTYHHIRGQYRERLPLPDLLQELYAFPVEETLENYDLARIFQRWRSEAGYDLRDLAVLPNSLLIRLLVYAVQTSYVWRREMTGNTPAEEKTLDYQQEMTITLAKKIDAPEWEGEEPDPFNENERVFSLNIPQPQLQQLERAFRATLDTAANRIDPWVTGFAWQRLRQHSRSLRHTHRLGAYGWVDGPFDGQPGPTDSGRLHTPSYSQTLAALILRDKYLSSERAGLVNDLNLNPWEMNISSSKVRLAEEFADEVRMGFHIYEVVGRHVENIIGDHQKVKALRTHPQYAMYPERLDPHEVCNGQAALLDLLNPARRPFALIDDQERRLQLVADALDTYADLRLADGIMQLVNRQLDKAADSMEAAAGFSRPPSFEFTRTPPSGFQLESIVVSTLPFVSVEMLDASASPARLVDPSVAAFLDARLGGSNWAWEAINDDDNTPLGSLTLGDLALAPADTLTLSDELLRELVRRRLNIPVVQITEAQNRAWEVLDAAENPLAQVTLVELAMTPEEMTTYTTDELHALIRTAAGAPADALVQDVPSDEVRIWIIRDEYGRLLRIVSPRTLGLTPDQIALLEQPELYRVIRQAAGVPLARVQPPRAYWLTQQLAASLGSRPAAGRDFIQDSAAQQASDAQVYEELRGRYVRLYTACSELVDALLLAVDDAQRSTALVQAVFWGAATTAEAPDREALMAALLGVAPPPDATSLANLAEATAKTLQKRLALAPKPEDLPSMADIATPLPNNVELKKKRTPDGVPTLAQALATLAAPNARLTVLACWQKTVLLDDTKLVTENPDIALDEDWLTVVAAARAPLARLEALQLELQPPLDAWSSSPDDPWQLEIVEANRRQRELKPLGFQTPRFAAAYGDAGSWAGEQVAVGIIDSFSEAVPMPQRSTSTAFGFNAPAARAPQAILLAVPPRPRQRIDIELLLQIVVETRDLAHARTVCMEDLDDYQMLAPSMWLQASPPIRVWLQPYPLFE